MLFGTISFLFQTDRSKKQASGVSKKMGSSTERVSENGEGVCFFLDTPATPVVTVRNTSPKSLTIFFPHTKMFFL